MEFFKGIGVIDIVILGVGCALAGSLLLSDLPFRVIIFAAVMLISAVLVVPIDDDKGYLILYNAMKYFANKNEFGESETVPIEEAPVEEAPKKGLKFKKAKASGPKANPTIKSITPFTGINGKYIEYGSSYSGIVIQVPSVEFRLFTEARQDQAIDGVFARVLRQTMPDETVALVKLDRPIIYDSYVKSEQQKEKELKASFVNGLLTPEELTGRIGILQDRINRIHTFNEKEQVYIPFHYLIYFHSDKEALLHHAEDTIHFMEGLDMKCHVLEGPELAIFLKYNYGQGFDEHDAYKHKPSEYMDWILPKSIKMTSRTVEYDGLVTHNMRITRYPIAVTNAWGYDLFNYSGTRAVMMIKPLDKTKSIRQIDRAIEELQEQGDNTAKTSKKMEVDAHLETLGEVLRLLQGDNETLFSTDIFLTLYDYEYSTELADYREALARKEKGLKKPTSRFKKTAKAH